MILQLRHKVLQLPPSGKAPQSAPFGGMSLLQRKFLQKNVSFLKLLRTFVLELRILLNIHANGTKQKTRLAVYGCRYRKGRGYFVSEVRSSTLRTAFLLINRKIK